MAIRVTCQCGKSLIAKEEMAGATATCPACQSSIQVPADRAPPLPERIHAAGEYVTPPPIVSPSAGSEGLSNRWVWANVALGVLFLCSLLIYALYSTNQRAVETATDDVAQRLAEAEELRKAGHLEEAVAVLEQAVKLHNANNLNTAQSTLDIVRKEHDAAMMLQSAMEAIDDAEIADAVQTLKIYVADPHATDKTRGEQLLQEAQKAGSEEAALAHLQSMTEEALTSLEISGELKDAGIANEKLATLFSANVKRLVAKERLRREEVVHQRQLAIVAERNARIQKLKAAELALERKFLDELQPAGRSVSSAKLNSIAQKYLSEHPQHPRVQLHAALAFLKSGDSDQAVTVAKNALRSMADREKVEQHVISQAEIARAWYYLGLAHAQEEMPEEAYPCYAQAARLDSSYAAEAALLKASIENLHPSPDALARAIDITDAKEPHDKFFAKIDVYGVLDLGGFEEVAGKIKGILPDGSVVFEYKPPFNDLRVLKFPPGTVANAYRGHESELKRYYNLKYVGWRADVLIERDTVLLIGPPRNWNSPVLEDEIKYRMRLYKVSRAQAKRDLVIQKEGLARSAGWRAFRDRFDGFTSGPGDYLELSDAIAHWREIEAAGTQKLVPHTWTRQWGEYRRYGLRTGNRTTETAGRYLNLPDPRADVAFTYRPMSETEWKLDSLGKGLAILGKGIQASESGENPFPVMFESLSQLPEHQQQQIIKGTVSVMSMAAQAMKNSLKDQAFSARSRDDPIAEETAQASHHRPGGDAKTSSTSGGFPVELRLYYADREPAKNKAFTYVEPALFGDGNWVKATTDSDGRCHIRLPREGTLRIYFEGKTVYEQLVPWRSRGQLISVSLN